MARQTTSKQNGPADIADLKDDIDKLRQDLSSLSRHFREFGIETVAETQRAGSDKIDELRAELVRAGEMLKQHGDASVAEVERTIQDRPILSMLAAFGVGMLVTRILAQR